MPFLFLPTARNFVNRIIDNKMTESGRRAVALAQQLAPVKTGELRRGISASYDPQAHTLTLIAEAPHSLFVEYGTRWMLAHPFMRPALNEVSKVWGGHVAMSFPTTPMLKGTKRTPHPRMADYNRLRSGRMDRGRAGKSSTQVHIRGGQWNGPATPWRGEWKGVIPHRSSRP